MKKKIPGMWLIKDGKAELNPAFIWFMKQSYGIDPELLIYWIKTDYNIKDIKDKEGVGGRP